MGYSTDRHLLLDLDNTDEYKAYHLIRMIQNDYNDTGCALLMRSYVDSYHVIYDEYITYERICRITQTLADLSILNRAYSWIRQWRGDLTLRISGLVGTDRKRYPPQPVRIIHMQPCCHEHGIKDYISTIAAFVPRMVFEKLT